MPSTSPTEATERSNRRRWLALVTVCLAMFMSALDSSIVNVALPAIQRQLHFSQADLTWVIDAYLITFGSFLLMAGRLGDLVGRKRVFLGGIALFTVSSAVCGLATSQAMLIIGRFVQGIGGALSASVIIAIIVTEFPVAAERAKAMSAYVFVAVGGGAIGLMVGGVLTQALNWHWIFFINVPIGIATLVMGRILIVENEGLGIGGGVDVTGSVLVTASLMLGIFAIVTATQYGWASVHTALFLGAAAVLAVAFVVLESRLRNPIMPLRILRVPNLASSSIVRGFLATGMFSTFFLGALYLENVLHYSPTLTGLAFLPMAVMMAVLSSGLTARLVTRFGAKRVLIPGMISAIAGLLLLARLGTHARYVTDVLPGLILLGYGAGTSFMPLLAIAMEDVPNEDAGLGSGIVNVSMQMAAAVGLALLSTIATNHTRQLVGAGHTTAAALVAGYRLAFVVGAVCVAIGLVVAIIRVRGAGAEPDEEEIATLEAFEAIETVPM